MAAARAALQQTFMAFSRSRAETGVGPLHLSKAI